MQDQTQYLDQLLNEKAELDVRIEKIQNEVRAQQISHIREAMDRYGITLTDLGNRRVRADKGKSRAGSGAPKYRDPATGKTWSGLGRRPGWLIGQDAEHFHIAA